MTTRPLVRYHGGKWMLAPWIISQFPSHRIYVEPFGGGGSVLLRKPRSYAEIYNDLDGEIVNLFRVARDNGDQLIRKLELTPFSRTEFNLAYKNTSDSLERARRTVIRSFMGFGSDGIGSHIVTGFRSHSRRSGTTPSRDWMNFPEALRETIARLQGVVLENRDAAEVIMMHDGPDTLHYIDPPYPHSTRQKRKGRGYRCEMTDDQHRTLADTLNKVAGAVIVSGYACPLYDEELFSGWERIEKTGPFCDGAQERTEVLWLRNVSHGLFDAPGSEIER